MKLSKGGRPVTSLPLKLEESGLSDGKLTGKLPPGVGTVLGPSKFTAEGLSRKMCSEHLRTKTSS